MGAAANTLKFSLKVARALLSAIRIRAGPLRRCCDQSGSVSLELVLLVPVLVLLTLFVLWAGRGGRVALTADLAAEEAATAAALCCEEGLAGDPDREAMAQEMLASRPGLEYLCVGGLRPSAPPDGSSTAEQFVREQWVDFGPGRTVRGVGVLGVQFECETDGAVAPLRGLFPTVTFHGQASEVVLRQPQLPSIGFGDTTFRATEGAGAQLEFTVVFSGAARPDVNVGYRISTATPSSAIGGDDYDDHPAKAPAVGVLNIPAGTDEATITVDLYDDAFYEGTETLILELYEVLDAITNADLIAGGVVDWARDRQEATGYIEDDDQKPHLFISSLTDPCQVTEGGTATFEVRLRDEGNTSTALSAAQVPVDVNIQDDTATATGTRPDYDATVYDATGTHAEPMPLTFNPGEHTKTVTVRTLDDTASPEGEPTETFEVKLDSLTGTPLGAAEVRCEILDDEAVVSVADASVFENDSLAFELRMDPAPQADIEVDYELIDDALAPVGSQATLATGTSCVPDDDYLALSGRLRISAGSATATLPSVTTCDDTVAELDETFWLKLTRHSGEAVIETDGGARGTIVDNDTPLIVVDDQTEQEPPGGDGTMVFPVSLEFADGSGVSIAAPVTLLYATADNSATAGDDYTDVSGQVRFTCASYPCVPAVQNVTVTLLADYTTEGPETFTLGLEEDSQPGLGLADAEATGTIEDDQPPRLSVSGFTGPEGSEQSFTIRLDEPARDDITVTYRITSPLETKACPYTDAASCPSDTSFHYDFFSADGLTGTLTFSASSGRTVRTVPVSLLVDNRNEGDETLKLTLSDASNAVIGTDEATGTITNVSGPVITVNDHKVTEGDPLVFTVTLANPLPGETVKLDYRVEPHTAKAGLDYEVDNPPTPLSGTLEFDQSNETATVTVQTLKDSVVEQHEETLHLVLSFAEDDTGTATLADSEGVGTIENVNPFIVRVSDADDVAEGDDLVFVISLTDDENNPAVLAPGLEIPIRFYSATEYPDTAVGGESCADGIDYLGIDRRLSLPQGNDTELEVRVETCDALPDGEPRETMRMMVELVGDSGGSVGDSVGVGGIVEAYPVALRVENAEGHAGDDIEFVVRLVDPAGPDGDGNYVEKSTNRDVTVTATTLLDLFADNPASPGVDFTSVTRKLRIAAGQTRAVAPLTVPTRRDDDSLAERFKVELSEASNASIDKEIATGTIHPPCVDVNVNDADNLPPVITVPDQTIIEGTWWALIATFSQPLCNDFFASVSMISDTATCGGFGSFRPDDPKDLACRDEPNFSTRADVSRNTSTGTWIDILAHADNLDEDDEQFTICVGWGSGMPQRYRDIPQSCGVITVVDRDDAPRLQVANASANEGDEMTVEVSLDTPSGKTITFEYRTEDRTVSNAAIGGTDYTASGSAAVPWVRRTIPAGQTSATLTVATTSDADDEGDETFLVRIRAPHPDLGQPAPPLNAWILDSAAVATILEGGKPEVRIADASGDEGSTLQFAVWLSNLGESATDTLTVDYSTVERPAGLRAATEGSSGTDGSDYESASGTLTFAPGDAIKFINVTTVSDDVDEIDETFLVELSNAGGVSLADPSAVGTIRGNATCTEWPDEGETEPTLTVDSPTANEGDGVMVFTATLTPPLCHGTEGSRPALGMTLRFMDTENARRYLLWDLGPRGGDAAVEGTDYLQPLLGTGFESLQSERRISVDLIDDEVVEQNEEISLEAFFIGGGLGFFKSGETASYSNATGTIVDDDQATLSAADASGEEGGAVVFTLTLDRVAPWDVTVDYATADGTAVDGADYRAVSGTATIASGQRSAEVTVPTISDSLYENDETFELRLSNVTGAQPPDGDDAFAATGTIRDNNERPVMNISDAAANEGDALVFAVTLDAPSGVDVQVNYQTVSGTATEGSDYIAVSSGTVTIPAGRTTAHVPVQTVADEVDESAEKLFVHLSNSDPPLAEIDDGIGAGLIYDISSRELTVSDALTTEGGVLSFEVGFDGPPFGGGTNITVQYRTIAGTATAGDDYSASFESASDLQTLSILSGTTSATVQVPTVDDSLDEHVEQLNLLLSNPDGATLANSSARGVIVDNDPEPVLSVSDAQATENGDGTPITFTLQLSEPSGREVSVSYATRDMTATSGQASDNDYVAASGPATIRAGSTTATVPVTLVDDSTEEQIEQFQIELSDATSARLGDAVGIGEIVDDDGNVQILPEDAAAVYEGDSTAAQFTVRLSRAVSGTVTVDYTTEDGLAEAGSDYTAVGGTLTFAAGDTAKTVSVTVLDDDVAESSETFRLKLSNASSNARVGNDSAAATILDDDSLPELRAADAQATEGTSASFVVRLSAPSSREVTVDYAAVADPTAVGETAAAAAQDFDAVSGTLTIAARSRSATVTVPLRGDSLDEHDETFWLRLRDPTGATIVDGTAVGTIVDDDPLPVLSIGDSSGTEAETVDFTVLLQSVSGRTVTVPWSTAPSATGSPASPTVDYTPASGTLTFAPGSTTASISVTTLSDSTSESDETFQVRLGEPTNAAVGDAAAIGTIHDDDGVPRIFVADTEVDEDDSPAIFAVTLSNASSQAVVVDYATSDGTATQPGDYATEQGSLTIPAGGTAGEVSVAIVNDDDDEGPETFDLTLSSPSNAVIAEDAGTATATIRDDESTTIDIADAQASEGDGTIEFEVTLTRASSSAITVDYATFDGTATQPEDYTAASGTVTIPANATRATIPITLTDDSFSERDSSSSPDEAFLVRLTNPVGAELGDAEGTGVITDDDGLPVAQILERGQSDVYYVNEDAGSMAIRVGLSKPSNKKVEVGYYTSGRDPSTCEAAHANERGLLEFPPGSTLQTLEITLVNDDARCGNFWDYRSFDVHLSATSTAAVYSGSLDYLGVRAWDVAVLPWAAIHGPGRLLENEGPAVFMVGMNRTSSQAVTVTVTTQPSSDDEYSAATSGVDFTALSGTTVTVPAGTRLVPVEVAIIDDSDTEGPESFQMRATGATNADVRCGRGCVGAAYIIDNESTPTLSVDDVSVAEDLGSALFVATLDYAAGSDVTVAYSTADGSATQPGDYARKTGTLTIPAGAISTTLEVTVVDDDDLETDETFTLQLSNPVGADVPDTDATATILDDESRSDLPVITVSNASAYEDQQTIQFPFSLDRESTLPISFAVTVVEMPSLGDRAARGARNGEVREGADFTALVGERITLRAGNTESWFQVSLRSDDNVPEQDESFLVVLHDPVNAVLGNNQAQGTILNNDLPFVSVANASVSEGGGSMEFTLTLHAPGVGDGSVDYTTVATALAGKEAAIPAEDYTATSGKLTFEAGVVTATITVPIIDDDHDEAEEAFQLVLSNPSLLELNDATAVGIITDDDPGWTITNASVFENTGPMNFTVERDHTSTEAVTLSYQLANAGSAVSGTDCSTDGVDFLTPSGSVTLEPTDTTATISITLCDDTDTEGRETLVVELLGVPGRKLTGIGTIFSND